MDSRNGRIYDLAEAQKREELKTHLVEMQVPPTPKQQRLGVVGRNERCPCGSGKKFKHCHLAKPTKEPTR